MTTCEQCGKEVKISKWNKEHLHININQKPQKHVFCSRQCKITWIFKITG